MRSGKGCESGVVGFGGSLQELFPLPLDRNDRSPPRVGSRSLRSYLRGGLSLASIGPAGQQRDAAGAIDLHEIARSKSSIRRHGACAEKRASPRVFWAGLKLDSDSRLGRYASDLIGVPYRIRTGVAAVRERLIGPTTSKPFSVND